MTNNFKFDKCSNHFFLGCDRRPDIKYENKEMCLVCYSEEIYQDLAFGIKYGKSKSTYKLLKAKAFDKDISKSGGKLLSTFQQLELLRPIGNHIKKR
jgi:hypothetical protein